MTRDARRPTAPAEVALLQAGLQALRVTVGIVFAATVFDNLRHHNYTAAGYRALITRYLDRGDQPGVQRAVMRVVRDHAGVAGPLQAITEVGIAVTLLTGVLVAVGALAAFLLLAGLTLSEIGAGWPWELVPLTVSAGVVALAALAAVQVRGRSALLERPTAGGVLERPGPAGRAVLAVAVGAAVAYLVDAGRQSAQTAVRAGAAVAVLLLLHVVLDALADRRASWTDGAPRAAGAAPHAPTR